MVNYFSQLIKALIQIIEPEQVLSFVGGAAITCGVISYLIRRKYVKSEGRKALEDPVYRFYGVFPLLVVSVAALLYVASYLSAHPQVMALYRGFENVGDDKSLWIASTVFLLFCGGFCLFPFLSVEYVATRQSLEFGVTKVYESYVSKSKFAGAFPKLIEEYRFLSFLGVLSWVWKYLFLTAIGFYIFSTYKKRGSPKNPNKDEERKFQFLFDFYALVASWMMLFSIFVYTQIRNEFSGAEEVTGNAVSWVTSLQYVQMVYLLSTCLVVGMFYFGKAFTNEQDPEAPDRKLSNLLVIICVGIWFVPYVFFNEFENHEYLIASTALVAVTAALINQFTTDTLSWVRRHQSSASNAKAPGDPDVDG